MDVKKCQVCQQINLYDSSVCSMCGNSLADTVTQNPTSLSQIEGQVVDQGVGSDSLVPDLIVNGQYSLIKKLGQGGMSEVWEAEHIHLGSRRALKFLLSSLKMHPTASQRVMREAQILAQLDQVNVIRVYDVFEYSNRITIVMELIQQGDLAEYIDKSGPISFTQTISWARQILKGISKLHQKQLIHRDIKSENILLKQVDHSLIPVITDLGIAQDQAGQKLTRVQGLMGTLEYMSPEQIRGQEYDHRVDIYAMGIMIFEMITGRLPFTGDDFTIQKMHIEGEPNWDLVLDESKLLIPVIKKALSKKPEDRFPNAKAFLDSLDYTLKKLEDSQVDSNVRSANAQADIVNTEIVPKNDETHVADGDAVPSPQVDQAPRSEFKESTSMKAPINPLHMVAGVVFVLVLIIFALKLNDNSSSNKANNDLSQNYEEGKTKEERLIAERIEQLTKDDQSLVEKWNDHHSEGLELARRRFKESYRTYGVSSLESEWNMWMAKRKKLSKFYDKLRSKALSNNLLGHLSVLEEQPNWSCLCYDEKVEGYFKAVTTCRRTHSACKKLEGKVRQGTRTMEQGQQFVECRSYGYADHPKDIITPDDSSAWIESSKKGNYWSPRKCWLEPRSWE